MQRLLRLKALSLNLRRLQENLYDGAAPDPNQEAGVSCCKKPLPSEYDKIDIQPLLMVRKGPSEKEPVFLDSSCIDISIDVYELSIKTPQSSFYIFNYGLFKKKKKEKAQDLYLARRHILHLLLFLSL